MFEKSLYDLIRGLRNHKGNENAYIENSLKECRAEIRGQDMDIKATALLKLIYLEMFGHDMSWASFHVLEVMSSPKYMHKRIGYLGAVQSFRTDTEVLMLATNMLKKDIVSPSLTTMTLPIITLPHVITSSLAMSVLPDLLPRLSHSSPAIKKKTIVTLYRLALVYPETLRPAWPKIKERLMDESEDPSVTAAIVNVVCELGWRRPQDFLPLAPRLFELLVEGGNNWMAIKLIKLFATMTPLEPRLVKKLLPPLTTIIRETPAMSLLYECINGIIQGGILDSHDEGEDEIATLCVNKLRGMIMVEGDPNLKYVALLAFNKIVLTHPHLVAQQEDVIMDCIDSPDMTIRLRALDLVGGMVSSDNLASIVARLMRQLRASARSESDSDSQQQAYGDSSPYDSGTDSKQSRRESRKNKAIELPDDYRSDVIRRILKMCSNNNYGDLTDFDWYIDILTQLARVAPVPSLSASERHESAAAPATGELDVAESIGNELRNVAVKVKAIRLDATRAAEAIIISYYRGSSSHSSHANGGLRPAAWIVGEFSDHLASPDDLLVALLHFCKLQLAPSVLAMLLQAVCKVFATLSGSEKVGWSPERKTILTLLMARIIDAIEPLALHPDLEVQERAVEFMELLRLAAEASAGLEASSSSYEDAPLLLTQAIPSLFTGLDLHSIAPGAQHNVPVPAELDLDQPISNRLNELLQANDHLDDEELETGDADIYYHQLPLVASQSMFEPGKEQLRPGVEPAQSYQQAEDTYLDPDIVARRKAERLERNRDDPFYIGRAANGSESSTPFDSIIRTDVGTDLDIDSIPIMKLDLGRISPAVGDGIPRRGSPGKPRHQIQIEADETLQASGSSTPASHEGGLLHGGSNRSRSNKASKAPLMVDSTSIGAFALEGDENANDDYDATQQDDEEMAKAMKEVEKLRLEMQRANERIHAAQGVPPEGMVVKKKGKKKAKSGEDDTAAVVKKKTKKSKVKGEVAESDAAATVKPKKAKKKKVVEPAANGQSDAGIDV